jgi:hypothetical protein
MLGRSSINSNRPGQLTSRSPIIIASLEIGKPDSFSSSAASIAAAALSA